jgi:peptidoglycan/xylan/chitin deacetylase (PgdA/CDA1 family)
VISFAPAYAGIAALFILLWLIYRYSLFIPAGKGLRILLYHKVSPHQNDGLTISADRLDRQLAYIKSSGYTPISFADLKNSLEGQQRLPAKPILITFDDGYLSTYELAYPLLRKHDVKATIFLPVGFIGGVNGWDAGSDPLMSYEVLRLISNELSGDELTGGGLIEFGLHSYRHENYQRYSAAQIEADLSECISALQKNNCPFMGVFAYPYGKMPKDANVNRAMRDSFRRHHIDFAVRIGSRINTLPPKDVYEMKRSAVSGTDSFWEFKTKLHKGRVKLF